MPDQFSNYWARMGARGRGIPTTAAILPRRAPATYGTDQAYQALLLERFGTPTGEPTGISPEPTPIPSDTGSPSVGGNILQYPFNDFGGPIQIGSTLPEAPLSGPIPDYGNYKVNTGGTFGFDPSVDFGAPPPEAPFYGPTPTYPADSPPQTTGSPSVGGTAIRDFGGSFDITGGQNLGYVPSPGYNYYDAGGGNTYVYDSNWNYLYTSNTPQPQTTSTSPQIPAENIPVPTPSQMPTLNPSRPYGYVSPTSAASIDFRNQGLAFASDVSGLGIGQGQESPEFQGKPRPFSSIFGTAGRPSTFKSP